MRQYSLSLWVATCPVANDQFATRFQCCVHDCTFHSFDKLELFEHLRFHRPLDLEARCKCPVDHCGMLFDGDVPYFNHLSYHHYELRLQEEGLQVLISHEKGSSPLPACLRLPYDERDTRPYDGTTLYCGWQDCNETFISLEEYFEHVKSHGYKRFLPVNSATDCRWKGCSFKTLSAYSLRRHLCSHTGERFCACPYCGIQFSNNTKLRDHLLRQKAECEHKCAYCHKLFATERLLHEHSRSHIYKYQCPMCSVPVHSRHNLRIHFLTKHQDTLYFSCHKCSYRCKRKFELSQHMITHSPQKHYSCDFCQKKFKKQYSRTLHMRTAHSNKKAYECHLCCRRLQQGIQLTNHLKNAHGILKRDDSSKLRYKLCSDGLYRLVTAHVISSVMHTPSVECIQNEIANINKSANPLSML
uniref:C2H2-type domain-containing protein n=1 Tax=Trichuris muris TaxID=70415 RepID=A0A5S6R396_TRIMR